VDKVSVLGGQGKPALQIFARGYQGKILPQAKGGEHRLFSFLKDGL